MDGLPRMSKWRTGQLTVIAQKFLRPTIRGLRDGRHFARLWIERHDLLVSDSELTAKTSSAKKNIVLTRP